MYSPAFEKEVADVLRREGGGTLTNDPLDPGKETKYGISKKAFPTIDIANLTENKAREIYYFNYWKPVRGDELPPPLARMLFDQAVNQGVYAAIISLQRAAAGLTNVRPALTTVRPTLKVDGIFGAQTLRAVTALMTRADPSSAVDLLTALACDRADQYLSINSAAEERFERGWLRRLIHVLSKSLQEVLE